jgi:hypothetical protein
MAPGFFYWVKLTAPAGSNTFTIHQALTTGNFDSHFFSFASGSNALNANCTAISDTSITQSGADVKFDSTSVKAFNTPSPTTVHYNFETAGQANSTQGLDLKKK